MIISDRGLNYLQNESLFFMSDECGLQHLLPSTYE